MKSECSREDGDYRVCMRTATKAAALLCAGEDGSDAHHGSSSGGCLLLVVETDLDQTCVRGLSAESLDTPRSQSS